MFTMKKSHEPTGLEKAIDQLLSEMANFSGDDDEYAKMVDQLDKLYKLKALDKPDRVDANTLAIVAGNLAGIIIIVGYESRNVVTSKALGFIRPILR